MFRDGLFYTDEEGCPQPAGVHAICTLCFGPKELNEGNTPFCPTCDR